MLQTPAPLVVRGTDHVTKLYWVCRTGSHVTIDICGEELLLKELLQTMSIRCIRVKTCRLV